MAPTVYPVTGIDPDEVRFKGVPAQSVVGDATAVAVGVAATEILVVAVF